MNVTLDHVVKRFGNQAVVDQVSLEICDGEIFFLLGPSGCGKTTLLRCVAGLIQPDGGRIVIGDRDVTNLPAHQRDTAMVFQSYALWPHMTVRENVAFGLEQRGLSTADLQRQVDAALALVRMTDRSGFKPGQLSGGQQQRVALARALVMQPACLLLDEPLSNLDANLRLEMRAEIRRICKESRLTAIYVTHDQKEALSVADRMAVMRDGRIEQVGAPRDVYLHPANRFVAQFIGETNFLDGAVERVDAGRTIVRTLLGPVTCVGAPHVRVGQTVALSLRPEVIRLDNPPPSHPNVFPGTVHDTVYLGEMAQHLVNIGNNGLPPFKAVELNPRHMARDKTLSLSCWVDPEDIVLLDR